MNEIILVTGGVKSGKSDFAEKIAKKFDQITYIALSERRDTDSKWQAKINKHKFKRPKNWRLIETDDLINVLRKEQGILLIDSIGGFIVKSISEDDKSWGKYLDNLIDLLSSYDNKIVIVGEQVGFGLMSEFEVGNIFAERLGEVLKAITNIASENWLTINGKAIRLDNIYTSEP